MRGPLTLRYISKVFPEIAGQEPPWDYIRSMSEFDDFFSAARGTWTPN